MSGPSRTVLVVGIVALVLGASLVSAGVALGDAGGGERARQLATGAGTPSGNAVTVTASGEAETEPDEAVVRVAVEATADDPTVARQRVADNASSMRAALVDLGLPAEAVRTTGFDIYEDRVRAPEPGAEPATTYRARHAFAVEVEDTGMVGEVIDTAVENGATSIHGVEFTLSEETRQQLRQEAIDEAMSDARTQADAIAAAGGLTITGVDRVRTGGAAGPRPVPMAATADAGGGTSIESGAVSVRATVTVVYNASS